ncbi:MAG: ATP-binding cassette domain-containing protein [Prevotellaceae bacterium]|jgi:ATPase subunit of ABC transporter with duplicated ATPase domains|nr:ATP-binding cassette domain-containing protein [Prevotellaceae bacterium]
MSINIQHISYIHSDKQTLFKDITFTVASNLKVSLIGNNGSGKSTLLRIIAGKLKASVGEVITSSKPYYIPQHFGQYNNLNIAQALGIDAKLKALQSILDGDVSADNFTLLNDDWGIEERALKSLSMWDIRHLSLWQQMDCLSGGEKTKVFLGGIYIHSPSIILFDEPSNHLDKKSREQLYEIIHTYKATMLIVSHDRTLLNLIDMTYELSKHGISIYGGNYEFYKMQKEETLNSLHTQLDEKERKLRFARKTIREVSERKQRQDVRGKKKAEKNGVPRIMINTLKNSAEKSSSKLKKKHEKKIEAISEDLKQLREKIPESKELKVNLENASSHKGKILVTAQRINFAYTTQNLWENPLDFQIESGDRFIISGNSGSGKTTLLNIILGKLEPKEGIIKHADFNSIYVDQEYSIINNRLTVFEQVELFNGKHLPEYELKTLLHRFLFPVDTWDKTCDKLSGGEKIKLVFCCLTVSNKTPDIFALDEPTNNLDIQSMEIITLTIKKYEGTVLLISHDEYFANEIRINQRIIL